MTGPMPSSWQPRPGLPCESDATERLRGCLRDFTVVLKSSCSLFGSEQGIVVGQHLFWAVTLRAIPHVSNGL